MKKRIVAFIICAGMISMLAGCANSSDSSTAAAPETASTAVKEEAPAPVKEEPKEEKEPEGKYWWVEFSDVAPYHGADDPEPNWAYTNQVDAGDEIALFSDFEWPYLSEKNSAYQYLFIGYTSVARDIPNMEMNIHIVQPGQ